MKQATGPKRRDSGPRVTDRDFVALCWIAQQYAAQLDQLQILLARLLDAKAYAKKPKTEGVITLKRALAVVRRWTRLGLVAYRWFLAEEPPWVWVNPEGLRLVAEEVGVLRPFEPSPGALDHLYHCNEARLYIEKRRRDITWTSERQMRSEQPRIERGAKLPHTPDAVVAAEGQQIAVEVELAAKSHARLDKVLRELASRSEYGTIWYFCSERSKHVVERRLEALKQEGYGIDKFALYDLDKLRGLH